MQWKPSRSVVLAAATAVGVLVVSGVAQRAAQSAPDTNTAEMLAQNFKAEHEIGRQYRIDPAELPPPKTGPIVTNRVLTIPFNGQTLQVPPGFHRDPLCHRPCQPAPPAGPGQRRCAGCRAERGLLDPAA